jgi:hypothetical protein
MSPMQPTGAGGAGALTPTASTTSPTSTGGATNLADVLERVLDKGVVIAGDIRVNLLDIELLTIKLRLIVASVETARRIGINWWETDPWLAGREADDDRRSLRERVGRLERQLESSSPAGSLDDENKELREQVERHNASSSGARTTPGMTEPKLGCHVHCVVRTGERPSLEAVAGVDPDFGVDVAAERPWSARCGPRSSAPRRSSAT